MKVEQRERTITEEIYIADDGTEFDDEDDCLEHERKCALGKIKMYDQNLEETNSLEECHCVNLNTWVALNDFVKACKDQFNTKGLERPGIYIYTEGTYSNRDKAWTNISEIMKEVNGGNDD